MQFTKLSVRRKYRYQLILFELRVTVVEILDVASCGQRIPPKDHFRFACTRLLLILQLNKVVVHRISWLDSPRSANRRPHDQRTCYYFGLSQYVVDRVHQVSRYFLSSLSIDIAQYNLPCVRYNLLYSCKAQCLHCSANVAVLNGDILLANGNWLILLWIFTRTISTKFRIYNKMSKEKFSIIFPIMPLSNLSSVNFYYLFDKISYRRISKDNRAFIFFYSFETAQS